MRPHSCDRTRRRWRLRLQGHPAARRDLPAPGWRCTCNGRCAGSKTGVSSSWPTANCREHDYDITLVCRAPTASLLAIDCDATVDSGAYSSYPFSACLEGGPGRLDPAWAVQAWTPTACRDLVGGDEQTADPAVPRCGAHRSLLRAGTDASTRWPAWPHSWNRTSVRAGQPGRRRSRCRSTTSPANTSTPATTHSALTARLGGTGPAQAWRAKQADAAGSEADGRRIGVGHVGVLRAGGPWHFGLPAAGAFRWCRGMSRLRCAFHARRCRWNCASARTRTARAWKRRWPRWRTRCWASTRSRKCGCMHGDTAMSPYSTGTWGSRCAVMSGGAVATACKALKALQGAAHRGGACCLSPAEVAGNCRGWRRWSTPTSKRSCTLRRSGLHAWYRAAAEACRPTIDPAGLEVTVGYKAARDTGTFSYAVPCLRTGG